MNFFRWLWRMCKALHEWIGVFNMRMIKISSIFLALLIVFLLSLYTTWKWPPYLLYAGMAWAFERLCLGYYLPWIWQKILNAWYHMWNKIRKGYFYKIDETNKKPFKCFVCRKPKKWYERWEDAEDNFPNNKERSYQTWYTRIVVGCKNNRSHKKGFGLLLRWYCYSGKPLK